MKEYKIERIRDFKKDTENMLNALAKDGWQVVCSYAFSNMYLILVRDKKK